MLANANTVLQFLVSTPPRQARRCARFAAFVTCCVLAAAASAVGQAADSAAPADAQWIWSPAFEKDRAPAGDCFFRKTFAISQPVESAVVHMAADNRYELRVNGQPVGGGADWRQMDTFDITPQLRVGKNVIAVRATNADAGSAGLVARVLVRERGGAARTLSTDGSWRVSVKLYRGWDRAPLNDREWLAAKVFGPLGTVLPWGNEVVIAAEGARFTIDPEFGISRVAEDELTGSAVAMTFTRGGDLLVSQERGPLQQLRDADGDGYYESRTVFSDQINTAQGILSLDGDVYAVGSGPEGSGLYRLRDQDGDGRADAVVKLLGFRGSAGEHGPHAVRVGPAGRLYVMVGNFARAEAAPNAASPHPTNYEGDVVTPRYEDPRGHAVGVPAPGGTIVRCDRDGGNVEVFAGGFRNPYDFAFNEAGELFTCDADMEWDQGLPWRRPTRINHVPPGAEFGWRSGWAKWPDYWLDSLPAVLDMGPGSPTGVAFYRHNAFPVRLHNTLFVGDWARGQVHAVKLRRAGAGYQATSSVFLKGRPMAVTDLEVGPDGALYFCTGGRGTEGGVYRVAWKGKTPPPTPGAGIDRVLRQLQPDADWARARIDQAMTALGQRGDDLMLGALADAGRPVAERLAASALLFENGPRPSAEVLTRLARDRAPAIRAASAKWLRIARTGSEARLLSVLLADADALVRRAACEAVTPTNAAGATQGLLPCLADGDRFVRFAARRAMEKTDPSAWRASVLNTATPGVFLNGAVALLTVAPDRANGLAVAARCEQWLGQNLAERDFLDLLRVTQLAILQGGLGPDEVLSLRSKLADEYPTADAKMNRELVRLLVRLQSPEAAAKMAAQLATADGSVTDADKLHIAAYASHLRAGWTTPEKLAMLRYYEGVRAMEGGYSAPAYVEQFARNFFVNLTLAERRQVLAAGDRFPTSALSILAKLPAELDAPTLTLLRRLDEKLGSEQPAGGAAAGDSLARLRVGLVAVLARSNDPAAVAYLHAAYENQPERRAPIAMALTQHPEGANWPILVDALKTLEGAPAREVLAALGKVRVRPREAKPYRNVILQGLRPDGAGAEPADRLLTFWSGRPEGVAQGKTPSERVVAWQAWYAATYPSEQPAELPKSAVPNRWSYEELRSFLDSPDGRAGDASRGEVVFQRATCIKCHAHSGRGERIGPELSALARRFQTKEVLESIVYPSHVVSDQYASKTVVAGGKAYTGVAVANGPNEVIVLTATGDRVVLDRADVEAVRPAAASSMPEGLLNPLSLDDVADLFAYLMTEPGAGVARAPAANRRSR